jgi:hypothetical protein
MNNDEYDTKPVKPLDGMTALDRKTVAKYFNRVGRGLNCRLDVPILTIEDVKWAAKTFEELAKKLQQIAFKDKRSDIWRILEGRYAMENAGRDLKITNKGAIGKKAFRKMQDNPYG